MKKILLFLVGFIGLCMIAEAQMTMIDSIFLSATGLKYGIYADIETSTDKCIFFDMDIPNTNQDVKLKLSCGQVKNYNSSLKKAMNIFIKWQQKAKENSVNLLSKKIPVYIGSQQILFFNGDEWKSVNAGMHIYFYVDNEGVCYMIIESNKITYNERARSSANLITFSPRHGINLGIGESMITTKRSFEGASIVFTSVDEITMFIEKLDSVAEWKKKNSSNGKLFR